MITALRLLQSKYSLSDEFIANAIRSEIERQALLDIKGVISNASPLALETMAKIIVEPRTTLDDIVGASKALDNSTDSPNVMAIGESDEVLVKSLPDAPTPSDIAPKMKANKTKGNRRVR